MVKIATGRLSLKMRHVQETKCPSAKFWRRKANDGNPDRNNREVKGKTCREATGITQKYLLDWGKIYEI